LLRKSVVVVPANQGFVNTGRQNVAYLTEVEKRDTYRPTSMPLVSEILCGNAPNFQVSYIFLPNNYTS